MQVGSMNKLHLHTHGHVWVPISWLQIIQVSKQTSLLVLQVFAHHKYELITLANDVQKFCKAGVPKTLGRFNLQTASLRLILV